MVNLVSLAGRGVAVAVVLLGVQSKMVVLVWACVVRMVVLGAVLLLRPSDRIYNVRRLSCVHY